MVRTTGSASSASLSTNNSTSSPCLTWTLSRSSSTQSSEQVGDSSEQWLRLNSDDDGEYKTKKQARWFQRHVAKYNKQFQLCYLSSGIQPPTSVVMQRTHPFQQIRHQDQCTINYMFIMKFMKRSKLTITITFCCLRSNFASDMDQNYGRLCSNIGTAAVGFINSSIFFWTSFKFKLDVNVRERRERWYFNIKFERSLCSDRNNSCRIMFSFVMTWMSMIVVLQNHRSWDWLSSDHDELNKIVALQECYSYDEILL